MVVVKVTKIAMATVIYFPYQIRVVFCNSVCFFLATLITITVAVETEGVRQQFQTFGTSTGEDDCILFRGCVEMLEDSEKTNSMVEIVSQPPQKCNPKLFIH